MATRQGDWGRNFGLRDQRKKGAVSIMANLALEFDRRDIAEFYPFVDIAEFSCAELHSNL